MKLRIAVLASCLSLMACPSARECTTAEECGAAGATCFEGLCVIGSGTGGGNTGGGATGGGTGGATGGGNQSCMCAAWQTCDTVTSTCNDVELTIVSPSQGALYGGGSPVLVTVSLQAGNTGEFTGTTIPAEAPPGVTAPPSFIKQTNGQFTGTFQLPNQGGSWNLVVGWTGHVTKSVTVHSEVCAMDCAPWQECQPDADGGVCADLGLSLAWTAPTDMQTFAKGTTATATLQVSRSDGGAFGGTVPFTNDGADAGTLTIASNYSTPFTTPLADGAHVLNAGWPDGGPTHALRTYKVDARPPSLTVEIGDGGAQQRDAILYAMVVGDEELADGGLTLDGIAMERSNSAACANPSPSRLCFAVDMSKPVLNAFDGGFSVTLTGTDTFNNSALADGGAITVTRLRWNVAAFAQKVQALAVGSDGTVYVGGATGSLNAGTTVSLRPDGGLGASQSTGEIHSLAVAAGSPDILFMSFNSATDDNGNIGAVKADSLTRGSSPILQSPCAGVGTSKTFSGLALYKPAAEIFAVGSINSTDGTNGRACAYGPLTGPLPTITGATDAAQVPTNVATATNVVVSGSTASFLRKDTSGAWWQPVTLNGVAAPSVGTPNALGTDPGVIAAGQSISDAGITISGLNALGRFVYLKPGTASSDLGSANADKGVSSIGAATEGYLGQGDVLVRFNAASLAAVGAPIASVSGDSIRTAPVLASSRNGDVSLGYAVSNGRQLVTFTTGGTSSTQRWRATLPTTGNVLTHPTFDCNRAAPASKTGILYVGTSDGHVAAIVVDSPRLLDTPGAWPKYQRTQGNAGNDSSDFPINWASCPP